MRGLDYYTRTVFEFVNDDLDAAQSVDLRGRPLRLPHRGDRRPADARRSAGRPASSGWRPRQSRRAEAAGSTSSSPSPTGAGAREILPWLADLRRAGRRCDTDYAGRSLKGQLTQAGRLGARATLVVESDGQVLRRAGSDDVEVGSRDELEELLG